MQSVPTFSHRIVVILTQIQQLSILFDSFSATNFDTRKCEEMFRKVTGLMFSDEIRSTHDLCLTVKARRRTC